MTAVAKRLTQTLTPILGGVDEVEHDLRWRLELCPGLAEFWLRMDGTLRQRLALEFMLEQKGIDMPAQPLPDVTITRANDGTIQANVPHIIEHSPTGFGVGYGGSGPADLALSILEDHLKRTGYKGRRERVFIGSCFRAAFAMHQDFKWQFIANLDQDAGSWVIKRSAVQGFIDAREYILGWYAARSDTMKMG